MLKASFEKIQFFFRMAVRVSGPVAAGIALTLLLSGIPPANAAETEEADFVSLGLISYSPDYVLSKDYDFIVFKIKNLSGRTITEIFGWVYRSLEDAGGEPNGVLLANNPHRGGTIVKGQPHRPGTIAQWRFPLLPSDPPPSSKDTYFLRVSPKGIFFARVEPPSPPPESGKKKK